MGAEILLLALWQAAQGSGAGVQGAPQGNLRTLLESGPPERCFDVLFVGDGYLAADLAEGRYGKDVSRAPFCPVCTEELAKVLQQACALPWNDAEYHRAHPLELWKK